MPHTVYIGLGANIGEPLQQLESAIAHLNTVLHVTKRSPIYLSRPLGKLDQPNFYNMVVEAATDLTPTALMEILLNLETAMGRQRRFINEPRPIDLDLLFFGQQILKSERLCIPHPRLHERDFVLQPLADIAPHWRHPSFSKTISELLPGVSTPTLIKKIS